MTKTLKTMLNILLVFGLVSIIVFLMIKFLKNSAISFYSATWASSTIKEAKNNKVFVREAEVNPKVLLINDRKILIKDCWIEKRTKMHYPFLFFKTRKFLGEYRLCFLIDDLHENLNNISNLVICQAHKK